MDVQKLGIEDMKKIDLGQKKHGFNTFVSDIVSYHRKLPDFRYPGYVVSSDEAKMCLIMSNQ